MRKFLLLTGMGLIFALPLCAGDFEGGDPLPAVWKEQRLNFVYMGVTSRYSCDGLREKVRSLLLELGARGDMKIAAAGCDDSAPLGRARTVPSLMLTFSTAALPDASAKPLRPGDLAPISARFQPFTVAPNAFRTFDFGDCELVEEFVQQILPRFLMRDVKKSITCVPNQLSGMPYVVRGEALKAITVP